ncbi:ABC transporter substrate-binding protein [Thermasporomyces composti]|jgi:multiple sugar transport system substrate-binding protein|uniref:Carbohydrate ABC transporter substrate-binding protein (CUT1 family) n=1 Tax=Thermasporomyces composti TaxID=696763 RepID=A0A3D9V615_THECX|nr:sugar ABC transporter substrate-binding protein [Thermasporomyces composti]REF36967.1 carbohydrate ABC transporter substrate-binding protein (CUT1 family) [Thermasporomyces composti]
MHDTRFHGSGAPGAPGAGSSFSRRHVLRAMGLGAALAAGAPVLQACGFGGTGQSQDSEANEVTGSFDWKKHDGKTVRLLMNKHPYTDALKANLGAFTEKTGIKVEIDEFPESNYFDKVTLELRSKQGNYDVFMLGAYMVWQYGPPGYLEDLNPWIQNSSATHAEFDPDDFFPNLLTAGQWSFKNGDPLGGDKQWMLPWGFETNTICYRKDVFDTLKVQPAETFDELIELATMLKKEAPAAGFDGMYGISVRGSKEWATIHPGFMTMYSRLGLKDFEVEGDRLVPRMNTPEAVEFTEKWAKMVRDAGPAGWTSYTWYQASSDLGAGKAAMLFDADIAAYFQNVDTPAAGKLAWHPGPKGPDGSLATNMWIWSLGMNSASKNKEAAWWFLQWATSKEHLQYAATQQQHIDAVRQSVASSAEYKDRLSQATNFIETFEEVIDHTKIQFTPQRNFFDATTSWAAALQQIYGGADAKTTLDKLASDLEERVNA